MEQKQHKSLAAAICAVMSEVRGVEKTGENTNQRYKYASDADLLFAIQPACARHGIAIFPSNQETTSEEVGATKSGTRRYLTTIRCEYSVVHADSDQVYTVKSVGTGIDSEDKGAYKAQTGALKYALRQLFLIPTGDDPDQWSEPAEKPQQQNQKPRHAASKEMLKELADVLEEQGIPKEAFSKFIDKTMSGIPNLTDGQIDKIISKISTIKPEIMKLHLGEENEMG